MDFETEKLAQLLLNLSDKQKAVQQMRFFKTNPGEYGEGDIFLGISVPELRKIARQYRMIELEQLNELIRHKYHEFRLLALLIMVYKADVADIRGLQRITKYYLKNSLFVNNWDLVDLSAHYIFGKYLYQLQQAGNENNYQKYVRILFKYKDSKNLWQQRISVIATFYFIRQGEYELTLNIAGDLLDHPHDLIHKAVGWMLREIGKRSKKDEEKFLKNHYQKMPRTMLRYAIEKFPEAERKKYLKGEI